MFRARAREHIAKCVAVLQPFHLHICLALLFLYSFARIHSLEVRASHYDYHIGTFAGQAPITAEHLHMLDNRIKDLEIRFSVDLPSTVNYLSHRINSLEQFRNEKIPELASVQATFLKVFSRLGNFEGRIYSAEHELNLRRAAISKLQSDSEASRAKLVNLQVQNELTVKENDLKAVKAKKDQAVGAQFVPKPTQPHRVRKGKKMIRTTFADAYDGECAKGEREWEVCDPNEGRNPVNREPTKLKSLPIMTKWGEHPEQFIERVLRKAWGESPPQIDLYVRAGRHAAKQLRYLWQTVELFWPAFLGEIIVVLDVGDEHYLDALLPKKSKHHFHVVYEHVNCMNARTFTQYSYLNLYRYTEAEYVVTLDSDCAFHHPVTPDLLFNSKALPILPLSTTFQVDLWQPALDFFLPNNSFAEYGHSMISQPVLVKPQTLRAYAEYIKQRTPVDCLEQAWSRFYRLGNTTLLCWTCQISMFLAETKTEEYDLFVVETREESYARFASHVTYELEGKNGVTVPASQVPASSLASLYHKSVESSTLQGLCRYFGPDVFEDCDSVSDFSYLDTLTNTYAMFDLVEGKSNLATRVRMEKERETRLNRMIHTAMQEKLLKPASFSLF